MQTLDDCDGFVNEFMQRLQLLGLGVHGVADAASYYLAGRAAGCASAGRARDGAGPGHGVS